MHILDGKTVATLASSHQQAYNVNASGVEDKTDD